MRIINRPYQSEQSKFSDDVSPFLQKIFQSRGLFSDSDLNLNLTQLPSPETLLGLDIAVDLLVDALELQQNIVIVGDFDTGINPIDASVQLEIQSNIHILNVGFQSDIRPFLKMMDVFVFPSFREGFGVSLMEAAAMGIPAISSDIIGCNEIIVNELNGLLIPPKSTADLIVAMERFIEDPQLLNSTATISRKHVAKLYEQKKVWQQTLAAYKAIVVN